MPTDYEPAATSPSGAWHGNQGDQVQVDYRRMDDPAGRRRANGSLLAGRKGALLKALVVIVVFLIGMVLGFALRPSIREQVNRKRFHYQDGYEGYSTAISDQLSQLINADNIRQNLKNYTTHVHLAATHDNTILRNLLRKQMSEYGLRVTDATYRVLLSYPNWERENTVSLMDVNGSTAFHTHYRGSADENHVERRHAFNAFAPNGSVQGDLVYVNYGTNEDFRLLKDKGVLCEKNILIMRDGKIAWPVKVRNAEDCGAAAVIFYCDHAYASSSDEDSSWQSHEDALYGSILPAWGDALTPRLPSVDGVPRIAQKDANLPSFPVQVIGLQDAQKIMSFMTGPLADESFRGSALPNVSYRLGPGYTSVREHWKVKLDVFNEMEEREITNVVGVIEGHEEPDRFVIIGCHYDAWLYGGVDPNTGTAILMELARVFGYMANKKGWVPRRTIVFVHWDAGEQGLIGSTEWLQEHLTELSGHTVAYINLEAAIMGNYTLDVEADPLLRTLLADIAKALSPPSTPDPTLDPTPHTLYDRWRGQSTDAKMRYPEGRSDHAPFVQQLGVATMWPKFINKNHRRVHASLDTFQSVVRHVDPSFAAHKTMAHFVLEILLRLATSTKLPLDCHQVASTLTAEAAALRADVAIGQSQRLVAQLDKLQWAVGNFSIVAHDFMERFQALDIANVLETRKYNDQLLLLSQVFIQPAGIASDQQFKNILFYPHEEPLPNRPLFTHVREAYAACSSQSPDSTQLCGRLPERVAVAMLAVQSAARVLDRDSFL